MIAWTTGEIRQHIEGVCDRVERLAPSSLRELVLVVAMIHEERDTERLRAAARAVAADDAQAEDAVAVALAFGGIWALVDPVAEAPDFVERHRDYLRPLLAFELAHEGAATHAMRAVARAAGLGRELAAWQSQL